MRRILAHALVTTALVVGCDSKPAEAPAKAAGAKRASKKAEA